MAVTKRRGATTPILIALACAAILFFWLRCDGDDAGTNAGESATGGETAPAPATGDPATPSPKSRPELGPSVEKLTAALEDYKQAAVYPPWSRPHDEGTEYKLAWNEPVVSDLPFLETADRVLMFRFMSDRAHVVHGEALTSWIEVWERDTPDTLLPATIVQAWVVSNSEHQGRKIALEYRDTGTKGDKKAGDHRYTNRFVPSDHEELATPQQVRIMAEVEVENERRIITRDFTYASQPVLEILSISDDIVAGSLVITLRVNVHQPGLHTFEANLMSGDGEIPIAYTDMSHQLGKGKTSVDLVFFGKVLHELDLAGPYQVRDLRGFLRDLDGGENQYWSSPRRHRTQPYRNTDFSAAAWDSEEKREKIRLFEELIEKSGSGHAGGAEPDIEIR